MKILTKGRWLWTRTIGSTILGEGVDSVIVLSIGFWGVLPAGVLLGMIFWHWLFKTLYESVATPATYLIVNYLKQKEKIDHYDTGTNFNPLRAD
jgi:queuosine precursor transporter